jgi:hypothetical protein
MSKFTVLVAHDVPNYGTLKIEARDADHALEILKAKDLAEITKEAVFRPRLGQFHLRPDRSHRGRARECVSRRHPAR